MHVPHLALTSAFGTCIKNILQKNIQVFFVILTIMKVANNKYRLYFSITLPIIIIFRACHILITFKHLYILIVPVCGTPMGLCLWLRFMGWVWPRPPHSAIFLGTHQRSKMHEIRV